MAIYDGASRFMRVVTEAQKAHLLRMGCNTLTGKEGIF